jgi:hypothetical protein
MPGSEFSAMIFGEYPPNPAMFGTDAMAHALVTPGMRYALKDLGRPCWGLSSSR